MYITYNTQHIFYVIYFTYYIVPDIACNIYTSIIVCPPPCKHFFYDCYTVRTWTSLTPVLYVGPVPIFTPI